MSGRFNTPRLMGNCENCYYATLRNKDEETGKGRFNCHRFPGVMWTVEGDYCGEFAWKYDASLISGASE